MQLRQNKAVFHKTLLHTLEGQARLQTAWQDGMSDSSAGTWSQRVSNTIQETMKYRDSLKRRDTTAKDIYKEHFKNIKAAEAALQQNWDDAEARQALSLAQQTLHPL